MSKVIDAADQLVTKLTALSSVGGNWSANVLAKYGDWAATLAPEISYDSIIDRKELVIDRLQVYVGFNYRELFDNQSDRCTLVNHYPLGIAVYQRFRPPGGETPSGVPNKVDKTDIDTYLEFCEDLEGLLYRNNLTDYRYHSHSSMFDHDAVAKQFLKTVLVFRYNDQ